jgi:hypothetical protein
MELAQVLPMALILAAIFAVVFGLKLFRVVRKIVWGLIVIAALIILFIFFVL